MLRLTAIEQGDTRARPGPLRAGLVSITCLLRGLPLFFVRGPSDAVTSPVHCRARHHSCASILAAAVATTGVRSWGRSWIFRPARMRCGTASSCARRNTRRCGSDWRQAGLGVWITEYLNRLSELETRRPPVGGDRRRFDDVRSYREAVARLSLGHHCRDCAERRVPRGRNPVDVLRARRGSAVSHGDAMPDHRRRRRLRRGSVGGPAQFSDRICVAAAGDRIDDRRGTVLWRKAAAFRRRCVPAGSRALCPHRGDDARRGCCRKRRGRRSAACGQPHDDVASCRQRRWSSFWVRSCSRWRDSSC